MLNLYIVFWRSSTGKIWTSERYAHNARLARQQFARACASLTPAIQDGVELARPRLLCVKQHSGRGYSNGGRFA